MGGSGYRPSRDAVAALYGAVSGAAFQYRTGIERPNIRSSISVPSGIRNIQQRSRAIQYRSAKTAIHHRQRPFSRSNVSRISGRAYATAKILKAARLSLRATGCAIFD